MLALVTCTSAAPHDVDLPLLQAELPNASVVMWDDPTIDWSRFSTVVIRSAWDYHQRFDDFIAWARHVDDVSTLWNPLELVMWNTDKRYLLDLQRNGIGTVPTTFVTSGDDARDSADLTGDIVVKPSVGAGSNGVERFENDPIRAARHIATIHARGCAAMIQPYMSGVDDAGETGLVFLGGKYSHAFRKGPILSGTIEFAGDLFAKETIDRATATPRQIAIGESVVQMFSASAYARVDLVPGADGPVVLEVEVTEPSLYLDFDDGAPARAAEVFRSLMP